MHIEILVEDSSGKKLLDILLPKLIGAYGEPHTWNLHAYKGIGRIPKDLNTVSDPSKRILLDQLPKILRGYGKTPGIDAVVVVLDCDGKVCTEFLHELNSILCKCDPAPNTMFRLAIEEIEAWYLGDRNALTKAYPRAKITVLHSYTQDSICNTWELLADAVHTGGSRAIKKAGWPLPGQIKNDWAEKIGPYLEPKCNTSPSFVKFCDGLYKLTASNNTDREK